MSSKANSPNLNIIDSAFEAFSAGESGTSPRYLAEGSKRAARWSELPEAEFDSYLPSLENFPHVFSITMNQDPSAMGLLPL